MLGPYLAENGRNIALLPETAITTAVTDEVTDPIIGLDGFQHVAAQCVFDYGSGGEGADFFLQTSFDEGDNWTDVAAYHYPGTEGRLATDFDGSSDYYTRGAGLTGAADGKVGLFSGWVRLDGRDGTYRSLLSNTSGYLWVAFTNTDKFRVDGYTSAASRILRRDSTSTYTNSASWIHVLCSWDLANAKFYLYIDDTDVDAGGGTLTDNEIDYTRTDWATSALVGGNYFLNGALAEFYFGLEYFDISVEANRRKFISASGYPVYLGANGSLPTGNQPIIYAPNGNPTINLGYGGVFTANGSPAAVAGVNAGGSRFQVVKSPIAVAANQSVQDGALSGNTILDGVMGDRMRVKYSTTGTFTGTTIKIDATCKG